MRLNNELGFKVAVIAPHRTYAFIPKESMESHFQIQT